MSDLAKTAWVNLYSGLLVSTNQLGPDKRHLIERIVEKNLIKYVSERQARKYSNEGDRIQQDSDRSRRKSQAQGCSITVDLRGKDSYPATVIFNDFHPQLPWFVASSAAYGASVVVEGA